MTRQVTNPEPLTLFTSPELELIFNREQILRQRDLLQPVRLCVDRSFAKVLPPGSLLGVVSAAGPMVRVVECEYKPFYRKPLYALRDLLKPAPAGLQLRERRLPEPAQVLEVLIACQGIRYLWGGSAPAGSPAQAEALVRLGLMREDDRRDPEIERIMSSSGLDCSGLFNHATGYFFFGDSRHVYQRFEQGLVSLEGQTARDPAAVAASLEPLDVVIFRGHMLIALPKGRVIQAVGSGINATTFALETGFGDVPGEKYERVVIDQATPILRALMLRQGRRYAARWHLDDQHFMIVRTIASAGHPSCWP